MEHKTLPPPNNHQEDENIFRIRREIRSNTPVPQQSVQAPSTRHQSQMLGRSPKLQKRGKRVAPTKRFKAKIAAEPNSDKMTTYLPNTKALMNTESQKTLKPTPESRPPPLEDAPVYTGTLMARGREDVRKPF